MKYRIGRFNFTDALGTVRLTHENGMNAHTNRE
jgi:hypothetical protein